MCRYFRLNMKFSGLILGIMLIFTIGELGMSLGSETFEFSYKFSPGQAIVYLISVHGTVRVNSMHGEQVTPLHLEMEIEQKVLEKNNDLAKISVLIRSAKTYNGSEAASLPEEGQVTTMLVDSAGKTEYISGSGAWKGSEFSQLIFPEKQLSIGRSWIQKTISQIGPSVETNNRFTFTGFEKVGNKQLAVFTSELEVKSSDNLLHQNPGFTRGKIYFDPEFGNIIKTIADVEFSFVLPLSENLKAKAITTTSLHIEMRLLNN